MQTLPSDQHKSAPTYAPLPVPAASTQSSVDHASTLSWSPPEPTDADILSVLSDLFAGRTTTAFGEHLDWWLETLQCDLSPKAAAGVALSVISKWHFDQRDGAEGVQQFKDELVTRARQILSKGGKP